jgi:hypothetical protein
VLTTPALFSTNVALSPSFIWSPSSGALSYQVQVSTATTFATKVAEDSALTKTSFSGVVLTGNTEYYWRVRARNGFGNGPWSELSTFTTVLTAPEIPVQVSPAAFAGEIYSPANLTWASARGAATYHVQLSLNPDFSTFVMRDSTVTGLTKASGNLTGNTSYYWRVRAKNTAGISAWSSTFRFTTAGVEVLGLSGSPGAERRLILSAGRVGFDLPQRERVVLRVFDLRGGSKELMNGFLDAGTHEIRIPSAPHGDLRILVFRSGTYHETVTLAP